MVVMELAGGDVGKKLVAAAVVVERSLGFVV